MNQEITPETRWRVAVNIMNGSFNLYLRAQAGMGVSREEALQRLKRMWAFEDEERLQAYADVARLTFDAG